MSSARPGFGKFGSWKFSPKFSTPTIRSIRSGPTPAVRSPVGGISSPILGGRLGRGSILLKSTNHTAYHSRSSTRVMGGTSRQSDEEMVLPSIGIAHGGESQAPSTTQSPSMFENQSGRMNENKDIMVQRDFVSAPNNYEIDELYELYERRSGVRPSWRRKKRSFALGLEY